MSKVTFDGLNKLIIIDTGVTTIDVKTELYEEWQNWELSGSSDAAFRTVGGDVLTVNETMPIYYFLINNWKIYAKDVNVSIATNLYSDDFVDLVTIVNSAVYVKNSDTPNLPTIVNTLTGITSNLKLILGLVQHNFSFSQQTYNKGQDLTSSVITLYNTASNLKLNLDSIASYKITANYNSLGLLIDYNVCTQDPILVDEHRSEFVDENGDTFILEYKI